MSVVLVCDATHSSIWALPRGCLAAGYTTGSGGIAWTSTDWANHPAAVRIDQDYLAGDRTADVLDVENGAATPADCPVWAKSAMVNYHAAARPGQRSPAIYANGSNISAVCNSLIAGGITSGIGIWLADWNLNAVQAAARVAAASGPFPVIGVQFSDAGLYDISQFSLQWLSAVSGPPPPPPIRAPAFPYPAAGYLGIESSDPNCHSGYNVADQPNIRTWQGQMAHRGWTIGVDGMYGTQSQSVCEGFQSEKGLTADGKVGPITWRASWDDIVTT